VTPLAQRTVRAGRALGLGWVPDRAQHLLPHHDTLLCICFPFAANVKPLSTMNTPTVSSEMALPCPCVPEDTHTPSRVTCTCLKGSPFGHCIMLSPPKKGITWPRLVRNRSQLLPSGVVPWSGQSMLGGWCLVLGGRAIASPLRVRAVRRVTQRRGPERGRGQSSHLA
jgi:hypothetical protein